MKKAKMFKNGEWVRWDGSDVDQLILEERLTLDELKERYPEQWAGIVRLRGYSDSKEKERRNDGKKT